MQYGIVIMSELDKVLLSPNSLKNFKIKAQDATLDKVIKLLQKPVIGRSSKQINLLQALTSKVQFFLKRKEELGESIHFESCKYMTYEFFPANSVLYI